MTFIDLILLGLNNMWRMKLRSALTIIGVVVGIGALSSMVSFGSGIQKNITDAVYSNDLFTSMIITSKAIQAGDMDPQEIMDAASKKETNEAVPLTDSLLWEIQQIPGVALAFPTIEFPARVKFMGDSAGKP